MIEVEINNKSRFLCDFKKQQIKWEDGYLVAKNEYNVPNLIPNSNFSYIPHFILPDIKEGEKVICKIWLIGVKENAIGKLRW